MTTPKYSAGLTGLNAKLTSRYTQSFEAAPASGEITVQTTPDELNALLDNYQATLADGTVRGLTAQDLEASACFRRDFTNAHNHMAGTLGYERMRQVADLDSVVVTTHLAPYLSVTTGVYRPGKELEGEEHYTSITDNFTEDDDFKAMREHLKGLSEAFTRAN